MKHQPGRNQTNRDKADGSKRGNMLVGLMNKGECMRRTSKSPRLH